MSPNTIPLVALLNSSFAAASQWQILQWEAQVTGAYLISADGMHQLEVDCLGAVAGVAIRQAGVIIEGYPFEGPLVAQVGSATLRGEADNYEGRTHIEGLAPLIWTGEETLLVTGQAPGGAEHQVRFVIAGAEAMLAQLDCGSSGGAERRGEVVTP
jgi:hypothetical protein